MHADFSKDYFSLFGLPRSFALDIKALDAAYRNVQREVHPDRFANASASEKRLAAQWATQANLAYKTLKSPLARGRYILQLHGIDTQEESNTAMPREFLMQQMEWREAVMDARAAKNSDVLEQLASERVQAERSLVARLETELSNAATYESARETVRKLRFLEKLGEEIELALEVVEG